MTSDTQITSLTPEQIESAKRLGSIFMPHAVRQLQNHYKHSTQARFVHYTSAESALEIIKSKRFWMRNTNCMSDYREVQHGFEILGRFFADDSKRNALIGALDTCASGAAQEALNLLVQTSNDIRHNTFISAVSEHDAAEDSYGRLSMWRAFGNNTARVGIVLNIPLFARGANALNLLFNPVGYLSEEAAHNDYLEVAGNVHSNLEFLRTVDRSDLIRTIFNMLLAGVVCLKHEGFREEREWRAVYTPGCWHSALMESSTEVIAGVPQTVYKIPLDATASESLADLEFSRLFDRLIVGSTQYPWPMYEPFVAALKQAGVADAEKRLFVSTIPIRT